MWICCNDQTAHHFVFSITITGQILMVSKMRFQPNSGASTSEHEVLKAELSSSKAHIQNVLPSTTGGFRNEQQ
jgi:homoserine kinase